MALEPFFGTGRRQACVARPDTGYRVLLVSRLAFIASYRVNKGTNRHSSAAGYGKVKFARAA
ncbi:MAG: hypothetical protein K0R53_46 [Burkholderiales bacterium]|jgi:hypothetical protein|nr:hypothetical protein [Burkholderiales bacterium]